MATEINDNWCLPCVNDGEEFQPPPEELEAMYQRLEAGEILELNWRSPGRRLPSPVTKDNNEVMENFSTESNVKNIEFDFSDDASTTPASTMRVRAQNAALKGSAKKKTANFANVIDAMKKNKRTIPGTPKQD